MALGAIGTEDAVEHVRNFVRGGSGKLGHDAYQAKLGAVLGLGYGAARRTGAHAHDQLAKGCSVESWLRDVKWTAPGQTTPDATARLLTAASFSGLALSGSDDGEKTLTAEANKMQPDPLLSRRVKSALTELRKVRNEGLRRYSAPRTH